MTDLIQPTPPTAVERRRREIADARLKQLLAARHFHAVGQWHVVPREPVWTHRVIEPPSLRQSGETWMGEYRVSFEPHASRVAGVEYRSLGAVVDGTVPSSITARYRPALARSA